MHFLYNAKTATELYYFVKLITLLYFSTSLLSFTPFAHVTVPVLFYLNNAHY